MSVSSISQPSGILLAPLSAGRSPGHLNTPVGDTAESQLTVAVFSDHAVKRTFTLESREHPSSMCWKHVPVNSVAEIEGPSLNDVQP